MKENVKYLISYMRIEMFHLRKRFAACIAVVMLSVLPPVLAHAADTLKNSYRHKGLEREYFLYLPDSLPAGAPLVLVLHGHGGTAMKSGAGLCRVADREKFAVCYPQRLLDAKDKTCWNVGYPFQADLKTDDVGFLCSLARHLQKRYGLSRDNTFCTGMSNGGEMCYLLAYLKPDVFSAVAPIAGLTLEWMYRKLEPQRPVPLMEVHGTEDRTSLWNGDPENKGGWGAYISVPQAVALWASEARCTREITEKLPLKNREVTLHRYVDGFPAWDGGPDTEVWLYEVEGGKHSWAEEDMDTYAEIWRFFRMYLK